MGGFKLKIKNIILITSIVIGLLCFELILFWEKLTFLDNFSVNRAIHRMKYPLSRWNEEKLTDKMFFAQNLFIYSERQKYLDAEVLRMQKVYNID